MQCRDLLEQCNEHLASMRQDVIDNWPQLRSAYPFLAKYAKYSDFERDYSWTNVCKKSSHVDLLNAISTSNDLIQHLLFLMFSRKFRSIIHLVWGYYAHHSIIRDTWMIIAMVFLEYVHSLRPPFPEPHEIFKKIRNKTKNRMRYYVRDMKHREDQDIDFLAIEMPKESSEQITNYHELMNVLKNRLKEDEYDALCERLTYEFYDRHKKLQDFSANRNVAAERRALKKSRKTLKVYFKRIGIYPAVLKDRIGH